jgi:hypothetical protein
MVFDDEPIDWKPKHGQQDFHCDAQESISPNAPKPHGMLVQINAFVDANHACNCVAHHSHTGIQINVNWAPIICYSQAQTTVVSSMFSSEFIAMHQVTDLIKGLCYNKLKMFEVPFDDPANVLSDNQAVVLNRTTPPSTL